jgi:hypothetical protein
MKSPGPGKYNAVKTEFNYIEYPKWSMGTAKRYKDKQGQVPGPNKYQIPSTVILCLN